MEPVRHSAYDYLGVSTDPRNVPYPLPSIPDLYARRFHPCYYRTVLGLEMIDGVKTIYQLFLHISAYFTDIKLLTQDYDKFSAIYFSHPFYKWKKVVWQCQFGENLVVSTRNLAQEDLYEHPEKVNKCYQIFKDKFTSQEFAHSCLETDFNITNYRSVLFDKKQFEMEHIPFCEYRLICMGMALNFISLLSQSLHLNIEEIAQYFSEGALSDSVSLQVLHKYTQGFFDFRNLVIDLTVSKDPLLREIGKIVVSCLKTRGALLQPLSFLNVELVEKLERGVLRTENPDLTDPLIRKVHGKVSKLNEERKKEVLKGTIFFLRHYLSRKQPKNDRERKIKTFYDLTALRNQMILLAKLVDLDILRLNPIDNLLSFIHFPSTADQLCNKAFQEAERGIYLLTFFTNTETRHCLVYVKREDSEYLFDPKIGLIKCQKGQTAAHLLTLIYQYSPPSQKQREESNWYLEENFSSLPNYWLCFYPLNSQKTSFIRGSMGIFT